MSIAIVYTRANVGIDAPLVTVEVHLSNGMPGFSIVGLPETAVRESKERVRSAILNSKLELPDRRITVNLAPAELPKGGGRFDLAIAIGVLAASSQLALEALEEIEFFGELALSGEVRKVTGILPGIVACREQGRTAIVPKANGSEACLVKDVEINVCGHLLEVCAHLKGYKKLERAKCREPAFQQPNQKEEYDLSDVIGQYQAKRALTIAAAGKHNLLMRGPPGTGKTMLASRISAILPTLSDDHALEVAALHSMSSQGSGIRYWHTPPFRAPHHTSSAVALVGGGSTINAGEISLAHNGVLFLDELPEFSPKVLEVMREPMESGSILISRARYQLRLPASFQLIAAMNPCPCGYHGDQQEECRCTSERVKQYQSRVSGPLLDRIDLHVEVSRLNQQERSRLLSQNVEVGSSSTEIRELVTRCQQKQHARSGTVNARLGQAQLREHCALARVDEKLLDDAMTKLKLSTRAYFRILKIARTIADLEDAENITSKHLMEAINYRKFDRR